MSDTFELTLKNRLPTSNVLEGASGGVPTAVPKVVTVPSPEGALKVKVLRLTIPVIVYIPLYPGGATPVRITVPPLAKLLGLVVVAVTVVPVSDNADNGC